MEEREKVVKYMWDVYTDETAKVFGVRESGVPIELTVSYLHLDTVIVCFSCVVMLTVSYLHLDTVIVCFSCVVMLSIITKWVTGI